jgi:hypothetical protein
MSYCRWSSDGMKSDVYVYASVDNNWTIHVAGRKKVGLDTLPPDPYNLLFSKKIAPSEFTEIYKVWSKAYDLLEFKDHTMPHAGESFHVDSPGECADIIIRLRSIGYHVPEGVIEALQEEQIELNEQEKQISLS